MGRRSTMYNVTATFVPSASDGTVNTAAGSVSASRRIGCVKPCNAFFNPGYSILIPEHPRCTALFWAMLFATSC